MNHDWLNAIPPTWTRKKLKHVVQLMTERAESRPDGMPYVGLENIESHTGRLIQAQHEEDGHELDGTSTVNLFRCGDILFGKLRPYLAKGWLCEFDGACTTEALVLRSGPNIEPTYLLAVLLSQDFIREVDTTTFGSKMPRADWGSIGNLEVPVPPLEDQKEIATAVAGQVATLDQLIIEKRRLLHLLAEKRRIMIAQVVTQGLNADAQCRDSGISWLGAVPTHWEVERSRWLFDERDDRSERGDEELLTVSHLTGVTSRAEKDVNMFMAESLEGYKRCQPGDLVINTLWAWMGAMGTARQAGIVSPAYNVYQPTDRLDPDYVDLLVRMPRFVEEVTRYSKGVWSSRLRLYPEGLYEVWFPVPPIDEQKQIVAHVRVETQKIDELAEASEKTVVLLQERRSALISSAVTGSTDLG